MRADEFDEEDLALVIDGGDQAMLVPGDIEDDAFRRDDAGCPEGAFDLIGRLPCGFADQSVPIAQRDRGALAARPLRIVLDGTFGDHAHEFP